MSRNSTTTAAAIKLGIFTVCSVLVTGTAGGDHGQHRLRWRQGVQGGLLDRPMLQKGDDVRIAGVNVGEVREVENHDRTAAMVTFRIKDEIELTTASRAEIRFLNLVGDRYLALEQGASTDAETLEAGATIPIDQTVPALDLTVAVQRLPAAVPGAEPQAGQRAVPQPRAGAPGRGRHRRGPACRRPRR